MPSILHLFVVSVISFSLVATGRASVAAWPDVSRPFPLFLYQRRNTTPPPPPLPNYHHLLYPSFLNINTTNSRLSDLSDPSTPPRPPNSPKNSQD